MMSRRALILLFMILAILGAGGYLAFKNLAYFAPPSISMSHIELARVERGTVMTMMEAEGIVEAESEVLVLSPASSIIKKIEQPPGSRVRAYQTILRLDPQPLEEQIARLEDQIDIKRNNLQRNRLNARSTRLDLDYQVETKKLRIASLKAEVADQEELLEVGGISPAKFDQTKQELVLAEKELEMIQSKNSIRLRQLEVEEEGLRLQIEVQEKELEALRENLKRTAVRAPSSGIILSIEGKEGELVSKDRLLVRMSDLSSFKTIGSLGDENAQFLKTGNPVYAILDQERLMGSIGTIYPEVQGKKVRFDVHLEESNHGALMANLSLKLLIAKNIREDVLRISNGEGLGRGHQSAVYVIRGNKAVKTMVEFGLRGHDYTEIRSGLSPGDRVIISSTDQFRGQAQVEITNL